MIYIKEFAFYPYDYDDDLFDEELEMLDSNDGSYRSRVYQ